MGDKNYPSSYHSFPFLNWRLHLVSFAILEVVEQVIPSPSPAALTWKDKWEQVANDNRQSRNITEEDKFLTEEICRAVLKSLWARVYLKSLGKGKKKRPLLKQQSLLYCCCFDPNVIDDVRFLVHAHFSSSERRLESNKAKNLCACVCVLVCVRALVRACVYIFLCARERIRIHQYVYKENCVLCGAWNK